jgi:hypothetical protein
VTGLMHNLELVRETGFEPAWCGTPNAPKAFASTYSATPAPMGRDRAFPITAFACLKLRLNKSMFGGLARTFSQRHGISLAAIGINLRWWSGGQGVSPLWPQVFKTTPRDKRISR